MLPHLAVAHGDARLGHKPLEPGVHHLNGLHPVVEHVDLSAAAELPQDGVAHQAVGVLHHVGLHRIALLRRGLQQAHVPDAHHGHVQRAGYRRCSEGQHVDGLLQLLDGLLVGHAEALLLVHHQQAQIPELHVLGQQPVGAHHHVHRALLELPEDLLLLRRGLEAAEHLHLHREAGKAIDHGGVVLLHQDRGGRKHRRLLAAHHGLEDRAQGHLGLAVAHIAAEQAVHHLGLLHVPLDVLDGSQLIRRLLVGEVVLKLPLPGGVPVEGVARHGLTLGVELEQVARDVLDGLAHLALLPLPLAAGQAVQLGRLALGADVLLHPIQLIRGHVQLVGALVADVQKVAVGALAGQAHHAHELAHAVVLVHHVIAHLQIGEGGDLLARARTAAALLAVHAVDVGLGHQRKPDLRIEEAPVQRQREDPDLPLRQRLRRLRQKLCRAVLILQRLLQALAAGHAARQQRHLPAVLPPFLQIQRQLPDVRLIAGGVAALNLDQRLGPEVPLGAQEGIGNQYAAPVHTGEQLVVAQQQLRLHRQRVAALQRRRQQLLELQKAVLAALAQALRLVEHDQRIVEVFKDCAARVEQHRQDGFRTVEAAARLQRIDDLQKAPVAAGCDGRALRVRSLLLVLRRGLQELLEGREAELRLQLLLALCLRLVFAALLQLEAQELRRTPGLVLREQKLLGRIDARGLPAGDGALGHDVEAADGVDLVVEELDAQRIGLADGVHVQDAAAQCALPSGLHQLHALIARVNQQLHQVAWLHARGFVQRHHVIPEALRGQHAVQRCVHRHHQRLHCAGDARADDVDAPHGQIPAGRRGFDEGNVPTGQQTRTALQQHVQILGHVHGKHVVGRKHNQPAARFAGQRRQQMCTLRVVRPVHRADPSRPNRLVQRPEGLQALQGFKQAVQRLLHTSSR